MHLRATYSHLHILEDLLLCLSAKWRDQSHIFWRENLKSVFSKEQDVILAQRKEMNENTKETQQRGYSKLNVTFNKYETNEFNKINEMKLLLLYSLQQPNEKRWYR